MKRLVFALFLASTAALARADLAVFASVPEWGALAREIGGDKVHVYVATTALQDPHRIEARPSLLAQARRADLVVATGADLEIGWLPLVVRDSGNRGIQPGRPGYFEAAGHAEMIDKPARADRSQGDVHVAGNPHLHLDPRNVLKVGEALAARMADLDPAGAEAYRAGLAAFAARWQAAIPRWESQAAPLRGVAVLQHHESFAYLLRWLGMKGVGTLEPKPGIEPSSGHLAELVARQQAMPARMVLRTPYQQPGPSEWVATRTGIAAVLLPYTVGGTPGARDLAGLFDESLARLLKASP
ncbi:MAG: zinc ABC transporter substrate-binding protein [Betaproteobacteria bacterium]|nr:zinc ABC transporter substrate-binding protein [Betaproteobacteria bacterium]